MTANDAVEQESIQIHQVGHRVIELQSVLARRVQELQEALSHIKTLQGILVENNDQTELLQKAFNKCGHNIMFVPDTKEILDVNKYHPDVILLEPSLFHWEWFEVLTGFKRDFPEIPVIL